MYHQYMNSHAPHSDCIYTFSPHTWEMEARADRECWGHLLQPTQLKAYLCPEPMRTAKAQGISFLQTCLKADSEVLVFPKPNPSSSLPVPELLTCLWQSDMHLCAQEKRNPWQFDSPMRPYTISAFKILSDMTKGHQNIKTLPGGDRQVSEIPVAHYLLDLQLSGCNKLHSLSCSPLLCC